MKKKIKDLTGNEFRNMCNKYPEDCKGCPFEKLEECYEIWRYHKMKLKMKTIEEKYDLEQEIEVDLSEEEN